MKTPVAITWGALLAASYTIVVPTLVTLLRQSYNAARQIEDYTASILTHAEGIERNTASAAALKQTRSLAPALASAAGSLESHSGAIAIALASSASAPGSGAASPASGAPVASETPGAEGAPGDEPGSGAAPGQEVQP